MAGTSTALKFFALFALPAMLAGRPLFGQPSQPSAIDDLPAAYGTQKPGASPIAQEWWRAFGDPELDKLIEEALASGPDVAIAKARLEQSAARARLAHAERLPSVRVGAEAVVTKFSVREPQARLLTQLPGFDRTVETYGLSSAAQWELDLFGARRAEARAALGDAQVAQAELGGARLSLAAEITSAYLAACALERKLANARVRLEDLGQIEEFTAAGLVRGLVSPIDLGLARRARLRVEAALPAIGADLAAQEARIDVLVGRVPTGRGTLCPPHRPFPTAVPIDISTTPAALLRSRPDLVAADRGLYAADARVGAAVAQRFPTISLAGMVGLVASAFDPLFAGEALAANGSVGMRHTLFDFGRGARNVDIARAAAREALARYRQAVIAAVGEVETGSAAQAARTSERSASEQEQALAAAAFERVLAAHKAGIVSKAELNQAELAVLDARDRLVGARAAEGQATVALIRALGGAPEP